MLNDTHAVNKELESISPFLASIPKNEIRNVPDGYFAEVEDQLLRQMMLLSFVDRDEQRVSGGYFENLEGEILNKAGFAGQNQNKIKRLTPKLQWKVALAASLVFLLAVLFIFEISEQKTSDVVTEIAEADYFQYLENNIDEYSLNMLIDQGLLVESDLVFDITESDVLDY